MNFVLIYSLVNSSETVYVGRPDEAPMFLSYIDCRGFERKLPQCPFLDGNGPTDGIVSGGKIYCPWLGSGPVDGLWQYQVAKVHCSSECISYVKLIMRCANPFYR